MFEFAYNLSNMLVGLAVSNNSVIVVGLLVVSLTLYSSYKMEIQNRPVTILVIKEIGPNSCWAYL